MNTGTILAHKHTLCEAFAGFFRALATERFSAVRDWVHPELEELVYKQCERLGEASFLRNLRQGLGTATQCVRLGASQAEGARQIRTELIAPDGQQAGSVRFVLSPDGWRIYAVEVWTGSRGQAPRQNAQRAVQQRPPLRHQNTNIPVNTASRHQTQISDETGTQKRKSKLPKMLSKKWLKTIYASG